MLAITAARAALESLLKVYIEDRKLAMPTRPGTSKLLKAAMGGLGADVRTHVGSAHGHGRRPYQLHSRHARLTVQAAPTFIEFFVETWNYQEGRS